MCIIITMINNSYQRYVPAAIAVIIAVGVYLNTLSGGFVSDDIYQVAQNPWVLEGGHLRDIFFSSVWSFLPEGSDSAYYRPLMYVSYLISHALSGTSPWGYHLINIVLHAMNVAALYFLALGLLSSNTGRLSHNSEAAPWAFITATLFALHTVNAESVAWVATVTELSYSFCFIMALYCFSKGRGPHNTAGAALFFFIALLYKETAIVIPVILFFYDLLFMERSETDHRRPGAAVSALIRRFWLFFPAFIIYLLLRITALGSLSPGSAQNKAYTPYEYLINILPLLFEYFKKLVWPTDLIFYAHMRIDPVGSVTELRSILLIIASLILIFCLIKLRRSAPLFVLAVLWIFVPLLPTVYSGWVKGYPLFAERYLYLSTAGFALLLAYIAQTVYHSLGSRRAVAIIILSIFFIISILYGANTMKRNTDWHDSYTLWRDTALKAPHVVDARVNYGNELSKRGELEMAFLEYKAALALDPERASTRNGLGILYGKRGYFQHAIDEFEIALTLNPDIDERKAIIKNLKMAREILKEFSSDKKR